jgi:hypothetical protein
MNKAIIDEYLHSAFPGATIEHVVEPGSPNMTFVVSSDGRQYLLKVGGEFLAFPDHEHVPRLQDFGAVDALKRSGELGVLVTSKTILQLNTKLIGLGGP